MTLKLKDKKYLPLIERREELKVTINKLMDEYKAIGDIIEENIKLKEETEEREVNEGCIHGK